jgi:histidinol-phosphate aminotransferase
MTTNSFAAPRVHGGPGPQGTARYDFSTNGNACGPCPVAHAAVLETDASYYPDFTYTVLRQKLAAFHNVNMERVLLAASASEFIFRISAWVARRDGRQDRSERLIWLPPHSYGDYAQAAQAHRLATVADAGDALLLWACEPSSPLGGAQAGLAALVDRHAARATLVLDRAYEPLRLDGAPALTAAQLQTVWQIWTPNKALGLTGVRAAYAIAPLDAGEAIAALDQLCPSWPVGAHGVAMLQAWVQPDVQNWLANSLDTLRHWKVRQIALCESMGWTCLPSQASFLCARPALPESRSLANALDRLRRHGVKLRDTASFGLPGHVRLSVRSPAAQDALRQSWQLLAPT